MLENDCGDGARNQSFVVLGDASGSFDVRVLQHVRLSFAVGALYLANALVKRECPQGSIPRPSIRCVVQNVCSNFDIYVC